MDNAKTAEAIYREARENAKRANKYKQGKLLAQVLNVSSFSEQARVSGFPTKVVIQHPFLSINAWIRGIPEIGTPISVEYTPETNEAVFTGYRQLDPEKALNEETGNPLYQELLPGELELMSSGMAHSYKSSRPVDVREAGLVRSILDGDTSSLLNKAVTYIDTLHQNEVATLKDTRRLGVVRRNINSVETKIIRAPDENAGSGGLISAVADAVGLGDKQPFAKEHSLILMSKDKYLLDYREGNVIEDDGSPAINDWTGKYLRLRKQLFNSKQNKTYIEVDSDGNVDVLLPDEAESGFRCNIIKGSVDVKVGNAISVISAKDSLYKAEGSSTITIQSGYLKEEIDKDITITAKGEIVQNSTKNTTIQAKGTSTLTVGGFLTNLGQEGKANHPLLFGDKFIQEFMQFLIQLATHTHPGISVPSPELAAACSALAIKCPTFVSMNVQTQ